MLMNLIVYLKKETAVRKCAMFVMVLALPIICISGGHGQMSGKSGEEPAPEKEVETGTEIQNETEVQDETGNEEKSEITEATESDVTNAALPDNHTIREAVYSYYKREDNEKISAEEAEAAKGKLPLYDRTIHSGEELVLMREWYDWGDAEYLDFHVVFSSDLDEWSEEELRALELLTGEVYVESREDTFPARALMYLTGAKEVLFAREGDLSDVTGDLPDGARLPEQIKSVTMYKYREGKYKVLLHMLEKSQVETITVRRDSEEENLQGFWLDDVAKIASLKELILENIPIRVRERVSLSGCSLKKIEGYVDADTDLGFVEKLANLEEASCGVLEELDLSPFLEKEGLSLYLYFCRQIAECEEPGYEGESYIVCPAFNRAVGWTGEPGDERFPAIYQRREDQGRVVECFTERYISYNEEKISNMWNYIPWIRVTDDSTVYELRPEEEEGVDADFKLGSFRTDRMSLTDINFDGEKDIVLETGGFGTQMLSYEYGWIWDQAGGVYESSPTYCLIVNPTVDQEHQLVRSFWRNSAGSHSWAIYRYEGGEFVEKSVLTEEFLPPDEVPEELAAPDVVEVIRWREEIMENGEAAEVKDSYGIKREGEETVYPDAYESYYAEDSYWGGA